MSFYIVYKATSPNGKCYIGITHKSLKIRIQWHFSAAKQYKKSKIHRCLNKYKDNIKWEVLESGLTKKEAYVKEKYYIRLYDSFNNGYNSTPGGEMPWNTGIKCGNYREGYKQPLELKNKWAKDRGTNIFYVYNNLGYFLGSWCNKNQCARDLNINRSTVIRGLRKKEIKNLQKYVFSYEKLNNKNKFKYIKVYKNNIPFATFFDISFAASNLNIKENRIRDCLSNIRKTYKNYSFKYLEH